jgi:hypothetical protein
MLKSTFTKLRHSCKLFSEIIPKPSDAAVIRPSTLDSLSDISKQNLGMSLEEYQKSKAIGADLFLSPEKKGLIQSNAFFFKDTNEGVNPENSAHRGWKLSYLRNMNLLIEYDTIFREFLQSCARYDNNGLKLTCEPRFNTLMLNSLNGIRQQGYQLEIENLRTKFDYGLLRLEMYKHLNVDRTLNKHFNDYDLSTYSTPLGKMIIAREKNEDISLPKNLKPFILATTMLIRTPMKIAIFNQNMTRKIYGEPENETIDYVVRFETQMNYSDFTWILPGPNKPSRLRATKITDFNNLARGNPYFFNNKWDLIDENERYNYMAKDRASDEKLYLQLDLLNRFI